MTDEEFDELRPSAFAIAYRMLGSVSEAEDVVQEGFLRLHRAREGGERIESPRAYLSTVVSRLSLEHLRSAKVRRETYVGEWLPEPLVASADDDPARKAEIVLRPRGRADRCDDPRRRGGPDPGRELDRQPGQAAASGAGGRPARPAARAEQADVMVEAKSGAAMAAAP
jgi:RNA polymerase sigma factor (sigma-70 family)